MTRRFGNTIGEIRHCEFNRKELEKKLKRESEKELESGLELHLLDLLDKHWIYSI